MLLKYSYIHLKGSYWRNKINYIKRGRLAWHRFQIGIKKGEIKYATKVRKVTTTIYVTPTSLICCLNHVK